MQIIIDKADLHLEKQGRTLVIRESATLADKVPVKYIESLIIHSNVTLETGLLRLLAEQGVPTVILPARGKGPGINLSPGSHHFASIRAAQHRAIANPDHKLAVAKQIVDHKCAAYLAAAHRLKQWGDGNAFEKAERALQRTLTDIPAAADTATLMGHEGAAAAAWFNAYKTLFAPEWGFSQRNRRPPQDPVNALLSLTYTIVAQPVRRALLATGYDVYFGFLHEPVSGREALTLDAIELQRPAVDCLIAGWLRQALFTPEDFVDSATDGCRLTKEARGKYYALWADAEKHWVALRANHQKQATTSTAAACRWCSQWLREQITTVNSGEPEHAD